MAKKQNNNAKNANNASIQRSKAYANQVKKMFDDCVDDILAVQKTIPTLTEGQMFSFDACPMNVQKKVEELLRRLSSTVTLATQAGIKLEWDKANASADSLLASVAGKAVLRDTHFSAYTQRNHEAMYNFMNRKEGIMKLSDRIWQTTKQLREEMEVALTVGIGEGKSAKEMAKDVKQYLNEPDLMFRRFRYKKGEKITDILDENGNKIGENKEIIWGKKWKKLEIDANGKKHFIDYDKDSYKTGAGYYKSAHKNAMRVTRTETNMAYKRSDQQRWQQFDFILGYHVEPCANHEPEDCEPDICEFLQGDYPKDFIFEGWHPQCYSNDSEVFTNNGWKLFKDVAYTDLILSLNPDTRNVEWTNIVDMQAYERKGDMIRFFNKTLDILVTPDHSMVYLSKNSRNILRCNAESYQFMKGAVYRGCEYVAEDVATIEINGKIYDFDAFCEFMGYWLADGSLEHSSGVQVASKAGRANRTLISDCVERLGYIAHHRPDKIIFYDVRFNTYLRKFGHAECKFVPDEIKNASKRQIQIFLNAFISCDGTIRQPKSFIGNKGTLCTPKTDERMYFTTSTKMAGDLSECILKAGKRPSFSIQEPRTSKKKDGTIITGNHRCWRIAECKSITATTFEKEIVKYDGIVYDLSLAKNHIMYIRRNNKCFWGSNCKCVCTPIMMDEDEMLEMFDAQAQGKEYAPKGRQITDYPDNFKQWCQLNADKIEESHKKGKDPYFIRHNWKTAKAIADDKWEAPEPEAKIEAPVIKEPKQEEKKENTIDTTDFVTSKQIDDLCDEMKNLNIEHLEVKALEKELTEDEIVSKLGGGDLTAGSCASLALSYIGNKLGYDVTDYRDGSSRERFSRTRYILAEAFESQKEIGKNEVKTANALVKTMEEGHEYYLATGRHAAIVRMKDGKKQYLELQTQDENGFKDINSDTFKWRFAASQRRTWQTMSVMIDILKFKKNKSFLNMLGFLNTATDKQKKGAKGTRK